MVDWAVESGADVNAPDESGVAPLVLAVMWGMSDMAAHLVSKGAEVDCAVRGYTPLMFASQEGPLESVRVLTGAGAELEARDEYGLTALMAAARDGHVEIVRLLLDRGADRNARTAAGSTALDAARHFGHTAVIDLLAQSECAVERNSRATELAAHMSVYRDERLPPTVEEPESR